MARQTRRCTFFSALSLGALVVGLALSEARSNDRPQPSESGDPPNAPAIWSAEKNGLGVFPVVDFTLAASKSPSESGDDGSGDDKETRRRLREIERGVNEAIGAKDFDTAAALLEQAVESAGKTQRVGQFFYRYASALAEANKKDETIVACRELLRFPQQVWNAYGILRNVTKTELYFYNSGQSTVPPGTEPRLHVNTRNVPKVTVSIYDVDLFDVIESGTSLLAPDIPSDAKPKKEFVHSLKKQRRGRYSGEVNVPVTEPGAYVVAIGTEFYRYATLVIVSKLSLLTKSDGRILMASAGYSEGENAVGAADIAIADGARVVYRGQTGAHGLFVGRLSGQGQQPYVVVRRGKDWAVSHTSTQTGYSYYNGIYGYSDRPVYRPGQTVHLKCIARRLGEDGAFVFTPSEKLTVVVQDSKWNEVLKKTVEIGDFGSADFSMPLADEPPLGRYNVQMFGAGSNGYCQFVVEEYKKPEYEVDVTFENPVAVVIGDEVLAEIQARYYFGEAVRDAKVSYEVFASPRAIYHQLGHARYAWFCGDFFPRPAASRGELFFKDDGYLDKEGRLRVRFDTSRLERKSGHDYNITIRARVTDKSRREIAGESTVVVARADVEIRLQADRYSYRPGEEARVVIRTTDLSSFGISKAVEVRLERRDTDGDL